MIRITKKDRELIKRVNANVRAKKNRLKNDYKIESDFYVKPISKFQSRSELNKYLEDARKFTRGYGNRYRKNKYGFVARVVDIHKAEFATERANQERKRQLMKLKDIERFSPCFCLFGYRLLINRPCCPPYSVDGYSQAHHPGHEPEPHKQSYYIGK